jgi:HAE1 family hydrophobic/amphiphilic exporter-1
VIGYFARHPTAANLLMLAVIVMGLIGLPKLQRDTFPVIPPTEVEIRVAYPGATPGEVEDAVCLRIEEALDSVAELVEMRCDARENLAITVAQMREDGDMDEFFNDVKSQVESITAFPEKVEEPAVARLERTAVVASIAITGNTSPAHLKAYALKVKERVKADPRIAQVRLLGFSDQDLSVEISSEALRRYGIGVSDIAASLERQSIDLPSGTLQTEDRDLIVRFAGQRRSPQELKELVVLTSKSGGLVRLGDIARIERPFEKAEEKTLFNGQRTAILEVSKTVNQDALRVKAAIEENLERERQVAPRGVSLEISQDSTSNIRERLRLLVSNGAQGLLLVFLVMWLFFSLKYSFWVTMGLPVSFLGAIFAMELLGYSLNMITLVALIVAIGLLMDDSIVLAENIASHMNKGKRRLDAVVDGVAQVLPGIVSSFLTTIMVVGPLSFMAGKMGAILNALPVILVITLAISLVEAFLILPSHLSHAMVDSGGVARSRFHQGFERRFSDFRDGVFMPLVRRVLRRPYLSVGFIAFLVMAAFASIPGGLLKYRALPELESDVIQARLLLPQGTPLVRTEEIVADLVAALKQVDQEFTPRQKSGQRLVRNISVLYNTNRDAYENGPHVATVSADLLSAEKRVGSIDEMLALWRSLVGEPADVISLKFTDQERGVAGKAIDIRLQGNRLDQLKQASLELQQWLRGFQGVLDLSDDLRPGKPEIRIQLKPEAGVFGVTSRMVADEVRAALHGGTRLEVQAGQEAQDIVVRLLPGDRNSVEDLNTLMIPGTGGLIPLTAVAGIEQTRGYARIHRVNGQRTVTVQGTIDTGVVNARELMNITRMQFLPGLKERYPGIKPGFQGQGKESQVTGNSLQTNILIGLFGVYLILAYQFRSYLQPLTVMLAIPTGLVGVVAGHLALGLDISMPSLVGMASLTGIVVNDCILLVVFIRQRLEEGAHVLGAAENAARDRFRAIILTSLTTLAGMTPLLLETSTQAQFLIPLVASLAFGLFSATLLSLFLVPALCVVFDDLGLFQRGVEEREQGRDPVEMAE